jgi:hypothetical protein
MSTKHEKAAVDASKGYEENEVGLRGIIAFGIGLLALILITFALMWVLLAKLKDFSAENAEPANPLAKSEKEQLPAEPRLQAAPGFGVDSQNGRINLELMPPASEYIEMRAQWDELRSKGRTDPQTGMMTVMPLEKAKEMFLAGNVKAKSGPDAEKIYNDSRKIFSDSSAGRVASDTRR